MKAIMKNMARQENPNTGGNVYENFASFLAPGDNSNALRELLTEGEDGCPINISQISCTREDMKCQDQQADICTGFLHIRDQHYQVTKWTDIELVAENDTYPCTAYTLYVNFQKEETLLFRRPKGKGCGPLTDKHEILRLEDGTNAGWKYYEKRDFEKLNAVNPEYAKRVQEMKKWKEELKIQHGGAPVAVK